MSESSVRRGAGIGRWLANRPMAIKFLLVIGVTAAVAIAVALTAINGMAAMRSDAEHLYSGNLVSVSLLDKMRDGGLNMRIDVLNDGAGPGGQHRVDPADDAAHGPRRRPARGARAESRPVPHGGPRGAEGRHSRRRARAGRPDPDLRSGQPGRDRPDGGGPRRGHRA